MEEAIQKADVLIEALQWIRQFRGKITVIKLGGSVMEDDRAIMHLLLDIVFMETVGMRPYWSMAAGLPSAGPWPRPDCNPNSSKAAVTPTKPLWIL